MVKIFAAGELISMKVDMKHRGLQVKVIGYLDLHDLKQRSFIKDQISNVRSLDDWSSGLIHFII